MASKSGVRLAKLWAESYGSAWVVSTDLLEGPWKGQATLQQCLRAMGRAGIPVDTLPYDGRSLMYKLPESEIRKLYTNEEYIALDISPRKAILSAPARWTTSDH